MIQLFGFIRQALNYIMIARCACITKGTSRSCVYIRKCIIDWEAFSIHHPNVNHPPQINFRLAIINHSDCSKKMNATVIISAPTRLSPSNCTLQRTGTRRGQATETKTEAETKRSGVLSCRYPQVKKKEKERRRNKRRQKRLMQKLRTKQKVKGGAAKNLSSWEKQVERAAASAHALRRRGKSGSIPDHAGFARALDERQS